MGGDVPPCDTAFKDVLRNSPYGRGCSDVDDGADHRRHEFPVWAGMFRPTFRPKSRRCRIPRMGGDVPSHGRGRLGPRANSPYGRGCSGQCSGGGRGAGEFPVWAGMSRADGFAAWMAVRIPRMGGDVPAPAQAGKIPDVNSPYGRGCSGERDRLEKRVQEFPVWAGMFLFTLGRAKSGRGIPRMGGDVPRCHALRGQFCENSPYGRGCSVPRLVRGGQPLEFPVWAGMFRIDARLTTPPLRIPRMGGDVPLKNMAELIAEANSPYGRGCSALYLRHSCPYVEFPVWAGMFRADARADADVERIPRMGGDVPMRSRICLTSSRNSPYGRGCSGRWR